MTIKSWGERADEAVKRIPPKSWEASYVGKHPNIWAGIKTIETLVPFGKFFGMTPSGRINWELTPPKEKALSVGLDILAYTGVGVIGKGFKAVAQLPRLAVKPFAKRLPGLELLDNVVSELGRKTTPFIKRSGESVLARGYNIGPREVDAWRSGAMQQFAWRSNRPSKELLEILDPEAYKKGIIKFKKKVGKKVKAAEKPEEEQLLKWSQKRYADAVENLMGREFLGKEFRENTFKQISVKLFGEEAKDWTLESINPQIFSNIALRMLDHPEKFTRMKHIGFQYLWPTKFQPVRFVAGLGEELFKTYSKGYVPIRDAYQRQVGYGFEKIGMFNEIVANKGLGKVTKGKHGPKFKLTASKDDYYRSGEAVVEIGEKAYRGAEPEELRRLFSKENPNVQNFIRSWFEYSDELYVDHMLYKIPQLFRAAGVSPGGKSLLSKKLFDLLEAPARKGKELGLRAKFAPSRDHALRGETTGAGLFKPGKKEMVEGVLDDLQRFAGELFSAGKLSGDEKVFKRLVENLTSGKEKNQFVQYLENYVTRLEKDRLGTNFNLANTLSPKNTKMHAFYTKSRERPIAKTPVTDLGQIVEGRTNAQAKELFFYPELERVSQHLKKLPDSYREYFGHYAFRLLGTPSPIDLKVANFLNRTTGRYWDEHKVQNLAYNVNNLIYMGGIGFKPFSAMRNMFQPFLTVPADMGGAKDIGWYMKGVAASRKEWMRDYIRNDLKAIAEFAPELHLKARAVPHGQRLKLGGKTLDLPSTEQVRDVGMFMFQMTDRWSRYTSGSAARVKWDHFAKKFYDPTSQTTQKMFYKKMNIQGRNKWIKDEIEDLIKGGGEDNFNRARDLFVNDVIGDTQFLYGITDSPIISQQWGALGKMGLIFQSWWMNYGTLLEKFMRTGSAGAKADRMFGFMLTAMISEQLMEQVWTRGTATRTVLGGPFPGEISEFLVPPPFKPVYHAMSGVIKIGSLDLDGARRQGKAFLKSPIIFIPGGVQGAQSLKGIMEEGGKGFLKSIIRYNPAED